MNFCYITHCLLLFSCLWKSIKHKIANLGTRMNNMNNKRVGYGKIERQHSHTSTCTGKTAFVYLLPSCARSLALVLALEIRKDIAAALSSTHCRA